MPMPLILNAPLGQLKTSAPLDYETKRSYTVTVTVSDGSLTDTITATINVSDIAETPANTGVCEVGDILSPGESCTYPGTDAEFSVLNNGNGQFLFFSSGNSLNIRNTTINGVSYTLVANKLASGSWDTITATINVSDIAETPANTGVCEVGDILSPGESLETVQKHFREQRTAHPYSPMALAPPAL